MDKILILNKLKEYKKFTHQREFALFLGIREQALSKWYARNTYNAELLAIKFPEIDGNWLLTGKGEMFKPDCHIREGDKGEKQDNQGCSCDNSGKMIDRFLDEIAAQRLLTEEAQRHVSTAQQQITELINLISK